MMNISQETREKLNGYVGSLTQKINEKCHDYTIGSLQEERAKRLNLKSRPTKDIFVLREIEVGAGDLPYAFHAGGRKELQFNVGFEPAANGNCEMFRYGVAFSFQPSRGPEYAIDAILAALRPKAKRFDEYFANRDKRRFLSVQNFKMWHWEPGADLPSEDKDPQSGVLSASELAREGVFLMLGKHVPLSEFEQPEIDHWVATVLDDFDCLFEKVYRFVEGGAG